MHPSHAASLDVADESSIPVDIRVSEGSSCTLECQASGTPLPTVTWTKNGQQIHPSDHFFLESTPAGNHRLIIKNVHHDHAGLYVANVKHKVLTQFMNFNVIITGTLENAYGHSVYLIGRFLSERKTTTATTTINLTGLSKCSVLRWTVDEQ